MSDFQQKVGVKLKQGGNVPGGHLCMYDGVREPFICQMKECHSIELKHTDVIADIGAYVGTYSIRCARFPVKAVYAYEPTPRSFKVMEMTPLPNLFNINAAIVGNDCDHVDIHIGEGTGQAGFGVTNSILPTKRKPTSITVKAINYKEVVKEATVVKIDIEGGEYSIPIGDFITENMRAIIFDFHPDGPGWAKKAERIIDEIESHGFRCVIRPVFNKGWSVRNGSWIRDVPEPTEVYTPMMSGLECCGCGNKINGTVKSICTTCSKTWLKKHQEGYEIVVGF